MNTLNKEYTISPYLILILYIWLGLWSVNFMGLGTDIALLGGIIFIILCLMEKRLITYSFFIVFYLILTFGAIYSITLNFYEDLSIFRGYRELFIPIILYTSGYLLMSQKGNLNKDLILYKNIFIIISIGLFTHAIMNLIMHLNIYGDINTYKREVYDIWTGEFLKATSQGSRTTLVAVMIVPVLLAWKSFSTRIRIILIFCIFGALISTFILANRSLIIILSISFLVGVLLYLYLNVNDFKKNTKLVSLLVVLALFSSSLYFFDILEIRSFIESSNLNARISHVNNEFTDNSRIKAWIKAFAGLYRYPMGGSQASIGLSYAHNLWLDIAYATGIIPFILIIIITLFYIFYLFHLIKNPRIPQSMKIYILSLSTALILLLMIEPIYEGHYYIFMVFIFQLGLMHGLVKGNLKIR